MHSECARPHKMPEVNLRAMTEKWERIYDLLVSPPSVAPRDVADAEDEMDVATLEPMVLEPFSRLSLSAEF